MIKSRTLLGLIFTIAGVTTIVPDAMARVCLLRSSSGTCTVWTGSVECRDMNGSELQTNKYRFPTSASCEITAPPTAQAGIPGRVFCSNGLVVSSASGVLPGSFTGSTAVTSTNWGNKPGVVTGVTVKAGVTAAQLQDLDQYCGADAHAVDFVPCQMDVNMIFRGGVSILGTQKWSCELPSCDTLAWDVANNRPQQQQYNCVAK